MTTLELKADHSDEKLEINFVSAFQSPCGDSRSLLCHRGTLGTPHVRKNPLTEGDHRLIENVGRKISDELTAAVHEHFQAYLRSI